MAFGNDLKIEDAESETQDSVLVRGDIDFGEQNKERTFHENVSVLDSLLSMSATGDDVVSSWRWSRMNADIKVRSLTHKEVKDISEKNTTRKRIGRSDRIHTEMDIPSYNVDIVGTACLDPRFGDGEVRQRLATHYSCPPTVNALISKVFLPGEVATLALFILETTGYTDDEDVIKALKGSSSDE